jgi:hypothetical protein
MVDNPVHPNQTIAPCLAGSGAAERQLGAICRLRLETLGAAKV